MNLVPNKVSYLTPNFYLTNKNFHYKEKYISNIKYNFTSSDLKSDISSKIIFTKQFSKIDLELIKENHFLSNIDIK